MQQVLIHQNLTKKTDLKSNVDKLDVDKLVPVLVDLSKVIDVVKTNFVTKYVYNARIKNIYDKILDITYLAIDTTFNVKINNLIT